MIQREMFGPVITVQPFALEDYTQVKHVMASLR
jgi:hypothetical protein